MIIGHRQPGAGVLLRAEEAAAEEIGAYAGLLHILLLRSLSL